MKECGWFLSFLAAIGSMAIIFCGMWAASTIQDFFERIKYIKNYSQEIRSLSARVEILEGGKK